MKYLIAMLFVLVVGCRNSAIEPDYCKSCIVNEKYLLFGYDSNSFKPKPTAYVTIIDKINGWVAYKYVAEKDDPKATIFYRSCKEFVDLTKEK